MQRQDAEDRVSEDATATQGSFQSSIEENLRVKQSIFHKLFGTSNSARTNERTSASTSTSHIPPATFENRALVQLATFATPHSATKSPHRTGSCDSRPSRVTLAARTDTDYDSDRTDFLATPATPCQSKKIDRGRLQTGRFSHYFKSTKTPKQVSSVRRKLNSGKINNRSTHRAPQVSKNMVLAPEYAPNHKWTYAENELLCVLWRWYDREPTKFATIFNKYFNLRLATSKIKVHFENYLRLHGPKAFLVYKHVYSVPFEDPEGKYEALRCAIEDLASSLGIELHRLEEEVSSQSGKARIAKSPKTRRLYRSLVRRASEEERFAAAHVSPMPVQEQPPVLRSALGGVTLSTGEEFEASETLVEAADISSPRHSLLETPIHRQKDMPRLVFRIWDANSKAQFTEEHGFVSSAFTSWPKPFPPPFPPDGLGKQALTMFAHAHLSMKGGNSTPFVSTTTSLLYALTKASNRIRPHIAVIDLSHPSLAGVLYKVLHAAPCLRDLKRQNLARWANYRGLTEYMIWSEIPASSIMACLPLADLLALYDTDRTVAHLLSLEKFTPGIRTLALSAQLSERNIRLDADIAGAMGRIAKLFCFDGSVKIEHVEEFVARLIDGWSIHASMDFDIQRVAMAFAGSLGSRFHDRREICDAFEKGIEAGNETIVHFAERKRLTTRRVRTI